MGLGYEYLDDAAGKVVSPNGVVNQDVHRIWAPMTPSTRRAARHSRGLGYEYLDATGKVVSPNGVVNYSSSYDMKEDAIAAARQAQEKLKAPSVKPGKYDLVLDPSHTWLTIHESIGHPLELDRVLGYEANYAGTSFATLDKREQRFQYGSELVNIFADKTQPGSLGAVAYDDEGVKCKRWDLISNGKLVDYQTIRDQAHILGKTESDGCCYADSWSSVQFQRMANVSMAPGKKPLSVPDLIRTWRTASTSSVTVRSRSTSSATTRSSAASCSTRSRTARSPACWKTWPDPHAGILERLYRRGRRARLPPGRFVLRRQGPAGQVSAVSHGSSTARFNGINVINTARSLG